MLHTSFSRAGSFSYAHSSQSASGSSVSSTDSLSSTDNNVSIVSCSGNSCHVVLGGSGSIVELFGSTISLAGITDGRATLRVDGQDVSCVPGQTVTTGSLTLRCTDVTADTVSFTAEPR